MGLNKYQKDDCTSFNVALYEELIILKIPLWDISGSFLDNLEWLFS